MLATLIAGLGVVAALLTVGSLAMFVRYRRRTRPRRALASDLEARLADAVGPGIGTHLERAPTVRRIGVLEGGEGGGSDAGHDGESDGHDADERPFYVPVVRIDLETTDAPGMTLVFEYVAAVLEAIHPAVRDRDTRVHRYDVEFTFGPDGLLVSGECRRVSVTPDLADRVPEDGFGAFELRRAVERRDRDDTSTTLWEACQSTLRLSRLRGSEATSSRSD